MNKFEHDQWDPLSQIESSGITVENDVIEPRKDALAEATGNVALPTITKPPESPRTSAAKEACNDGSKLNPLAKKTAQKTADVSQENCLFKFLGSIFGLKQQNQHPSNQKEIELEDVEIVELIEAGSQDDINRLSFDVQEAVNVDQNVNPPADEPKNGNNNDAGNQEAQAFHRNENSEELTNDVENDSDDVGGDDEGFVDAPEADTLVGKKEQDPEQTQDIVDSGIQKVVEDKDKKVDDDSSGKASGDVPKNDTVSPPAAEPPNNSSSSLSTPSSTPVRKVEDTPTQTVVDLPVGSPPLSPVSPSAVNIADKITLALEMDLQDIRDQSPAKILKKGLLDLMRDMKLNGDELGPVTLERTTDNSNGVRVFKRDDFGNAIIEETYTIMVKDKTGKKTYKRSLTRIDYAIGCNPRTENGRQLAASLADSRFEQIIMKYVLSAVPGNEQFAKTELAESTIIYFSLKKDENTIDIDRVGTTSELLVDKKVDVDNAKDILVVAPTTYKIDPQTLLRINESDPNKPKEWIEIPSGRYNFLREVASEEISIPIEKNGKKTIKEKKFNELKNVVKTQMEDAKNSILKRLKFIEDLSKKEKSNEKYVETLMKTCENKIGRLEKLYKEIEKLKNKNKYELTKEQEKEIDKYINEIKKEKDLADKKIEEVNEKLEAEKAKKEAKKREAEKAENARSQTKQNDSAKPEEPKPVANPQEPKKPEEK